jgi:hypothetical protein
MSQFNVSGVITKLADEAISAYQRVKLTATGVAVAGSEEFAIGFAQANAALGENVAVKLVNSQGTFKAIASEAITIGATLYASADGKVDTAGTTARFVALEAASADNAILEVVPTSLA